MCCCCLNVHGSGTDENNSFERGVSDKDFEGVGRLQRKNLNTTRPALLFDAVPRLS